MVPAEKLDLSTVKYEHEVIQGISFHELYMSECVFVYGKCDLSDPLT